MLGVFVGVYPIWEAYERGEWEVGVEVGVGAAAGVSRVRVAVLREKEPNEADLVGKYS